MGYPLGPVEGLWVPDKANSQGWKRHGGTKNIYTDSNSIDSVPGAISPAVPPVQLLSGDYLTGHSVTANGTTPTDIDVSMFSMFGFKLNVSTLGGLTNIQFKLNFKGDDGQYYTAIQSGVITTTPNFFANSSGWGIVPSSNSGTSFFVPCAEKFFQLQWVVTGAGTAVFTASVLAR